MRVLVPGGNGQVGWELARRGVQHGFEILALDRGSLDITEPDAVVRELNKSGVSLVVNAAAYTEVDKAELESDLAFAVNRDGPANLASTCAKVGIPLIHLSTDYVFDGRKQGPYLETDPVSPLGVYGESKAAGEEEVKTRMREHIILRTAWVYGVHGHNFVKSMLHLGQTKEVIEVVADQYGSPTYAGDLAGAILTIASRLKEVRQPVWGIYHYCGQGMTTWHGFAEAILAMAQQYSSLKVREIKPISTAEYHAQAQRPANSSLDCSLLEEKFGISPRPWSESLSRMIKAMFLIEKSEP
jgi:dTDP-4-dehydrorhamnose reductase